MKKYSFVVVCIAIVFLWSCKSKSVELCPVDPENYNTYHLNRKGFHHIFEVDVGRKYRKCTGCHHIAAERCELVKIERDKSGRFGVFTAQVTVTNSKGELYCVKKSTFFPEHWSVQTTLNKIEEAYQDALKNRNKAYLFEDTVEQDEEDSYYDNNDDEEEEDNYIYNHNLYKKKKRKTLIGKTSEGVRIKIILDKYNSDSIYNAYPVIESAKKPISVRRY